MNFGQKLLTIISLFFACRVLAGPAANTPPTILTEQWPPITYEENGVVKGVAVEIVQAMQKTMGDRQPIIVVPWPRGYRMVQKDSNVILFTVIRSKEREQLFTLLGPVGIGETALCGREDSHLNVRTLEDARKLLAISANRDSYFASFLDNADFTNLILTKDPWQEARLLANKRVDLIIGDPDVIKAAMQKIGEGNIRIKKYLVIDKFQYHIAFSPGTPRRTMDAWKSALIKIKKDGTYKQIYKKWFPDASPPMNVELVGLDAK
ncbi:substrate-binding periplasmic protein [Bdellovibrio bacteriovorus]|uniref:substrate-binding periplasmic protein n=1 Tax=Bdellovibrio bacteriovorus TaxID=959 RepID=UPI003D06CF69